MMDAAQARSVLGVGRHAAPAEVRAAYLRLVLEHHPDRAGAATAATTTAATATRARLTATINEAYSVLRALPTARAPAPPAAPPGAPPPPAPPPPAPPRCAGPAADVRRLCLGASQADAFGAVLESLHVLGHVSYVDRSSAVLEVVVTPEPGQATSMLVVLETPADARLRVPDEWDGPVTVATVCVEPLGRHPPASLDDLVERLASLLARERPPAPG
ncbi:MAG: J domain-containing protein [Acidimicrobiia bacterium]|nr:J domain-containing protein [Acidimicrobiia bacterium]